MTKLNGSATALTRTEAQRKARRKAEQYFETSCVEVTLLDAREEPFEDIATDWEATVEHTPDPITGACTNCYSAVEHFPEPYPVQQAKQD